MSDDVCVTCRRSHPIMLTIEVHVGRRVEERMVCNRCELEWRKRRASK